MAKDAIYDAALEVISQSKNENLRMQDIADAAGIATGTLYNYFENKESILYYVDRRLHGQIIEKIQAVGDQSGGALEKLSNLFGMIFKFCEEYHVVFDLAEKFRVDDQVPTKEKKQGINQAINSIKQVLDEGVKQKVFKPVDTGAAAEMFFYAMVGILHLQKYTGEYNYSKNCKLLLKTCRDHLGVKK
ncbi:MAG: TetR/AcrR family transcriptional regulator [Planctomycetota bacterium]